MQEVRSSTELELQAAEHRATVTELKDKLAQLGIPQGEANTLSDSKPWIQYSSSIVFRTLLTIDPSVPVPCAYRFLPPAFSFQRLLLCLV
jgi:hypothetical protein